MGASTGRLLGGLRDGLVARKKVPVLFLGLDAAGKTTMIWKLNPSRQVVPGSFTIWTPETFEYHCLSATCWDVGGQEKIRPIWRHFFPGVRALVFVVDSNDAERVPDARRELARLLEEERDLRECAVLVLANKQDLPGALGVGEVAAALGLHGLGPRARAPAAGPLRRGGDGAAAAGVAGVPLFVRQQVDAAPLCVTVAPDGTTADLRRAVEAAGGPPACLQCLSYGGQPLADGAELADCSVCPEATIDLRVCAEPLRSHPRKWEIFGTCATSGDGLHDALDWLVRTVA